MSSIQTPIRKNDNVVVVTGKDRGKRGRVLRLVPSKNRLIVEEAPHEAEPRPKREGRRRRERGATACVQCAARVSRM